MKIVEFAFVAYAVSNIPRARAFYEGVLGLTPNAGPGEGKGTWIEYEIGPHTLGIGIVPFMTPGGDGACLTFEVEDLDEAVAHLKMHEVTFAEEPFEGPKCRGAIILDPDGNKLGLHQRKIPA